MTFTDNVAFALFAISFAGFLLLYTVSSMYLVYRRRQKNFADYLKSASVPLGIIGTYMIIMGIWGQFTWPLPGSYNILFYDPLVAFGMLLLGFSLSVKYKVRLEYIGFLGLMVGVMVIIYGIEGYSLGLTAAPLGLLAMYFLYGLAGVLSYPVSLIADRLPGFQKKRVWIGWTLILIAFWIFILLASVLSAYIGIVAVPAHLLNPP